jgi:hypothetical protein
MMNVKRTMNINSAYRVAVGIAVAAALLDALSSTPAGSSVARLVSMPICAASLRILVRKAD